MTAPSTRWSGGAGSDAPTEPGLDAPRRRFRGRGLRLQVLRVEAKFKYDDQKPVAQRERVAARLRERGRGLDLDTAAQQERRLGALGEWRTDDTT